MATKTNWHYAEQILPIEHLNVIGYFPELKEESPYGGYRVCTYSKSKGWRYSQWEYCSEFFIEGEENVIPEFWCYMEMESTSVKLYMLEPCSNSEEIEFLGFHNSWKCKGNPTGVRLFVPYIVFHLYESGKPAVVSPEESYFMSTYFNEETGEHVWEEHEYPSIVNELLWCEIPQVNSNPETII